MLPAFIAWQAPAGWALKLAKSGNPGLSWSGSSGSVWRGAADNVYWQGLALGRLEWRLLGLDRWSGPVTQWAVTGASSQYRLQARLTAAGGELERLEGLEASLPAAWVDLGEAVPFVYLTGTLDLDVALVELRNGLPVGGNGNIRWHDAGLGGLVSEALGDIQVDFADAGREPAGGLGFKISTLRARDIRVSGAGRLDGNAYEIDLRLQVAQHRPDLIELLEPLGEPGRDGQIRLQWQGKLYP